MAAIFVIEMEDVLLARMQCSGAASSICLNIFNLRSTFSVAASITRSACLTLSFNEVSVVIFCKAESFCSSVIIFFITCRSRFFFYRS